MTEQGKSSIDRPAVTQETDVVELRLLLPSKQVAALEAAAVRLELSVTALVRLAISDFLQSPKVIGFVGEIAGRPTAPLSEGIR